MVGVFRQQDVNGSAEAYVMLGWSGTNRY